MEVEQTNASEHLSMHSADELGSLERSMQELGGFRRLIQDTSTEPVFRCVQYPTWCVATGSSSRASMLRTALYKSLKMFSQDTGSCMLYLGKGVPIVTVPKL